MDSGEPLSHGKIFMKIHQKIMIFMNFWTLYAYPRSVDTVSRHFSSENEWCGAVPAPALIFRKLRPEITVFETFYVPGNLQNEQKSSKIHDYWLYPSQDISELPGSLLTRPICRLISLTSLLGWWKLEFHPIKCQGAAWRARIGNLRLFDAEHPIHSMRLPPTPCLSPTSQ